MVIDHLHGTDVADPYRWLEDGDASEVLRWTEAENAVTRRTLDKVPGRAALEKRLWELFEVGALGVPVSRATTMGTLGGSPNPPATGPAGQSPSVPTRSAGRRYFYTRRDGKQNQPVLYTRDGLDGQDRVLVDVNVERADGTRALDWWFPSDDGARVAYGVSDDGSEESALRVRELATGRDSDEIPRTRACSLAWLPDGRGFYYTRYPAPGEVPPAEAKYHRSVFLHRLGDDPARDRKLYGDGRAMTDWPGVDLSPSGRWLVITVSEGWSKSELYLLDTRAGGPPVALATGEEARFEVVEALDDRIYVLTTSGAPRGRVYAIDPAQPARAKWREVLKQGDDILQQVAYFQGGLAASTLHDAAARLHLYAADGAHRGEIALPALGALTGLSGARDAAELFYGFTSLFTPTTVFHTGGDAPASKSALGTLGGFPNPPAMGSGERSPPTPTLWRRLETNLDPAAFEVERVMVTSRDGSRAPLFLAHRKGTPRDGARPTVLTGYGGFDHSTLPVWTPAAIPFLERGGTYALAVLRGGGEYGEDWHQAGMLARKQNVFDDFIAAAKWLVDNKITNPKKLAISGRSNGGLLVGAALTQRPDLYRAVVCGVPLLDMIRYPRFRIAALWTPEYGSPDDPEAFRWLRAYSPYHNVRDRVAYPAVYFYTATSDTRVDPMHARKMTARLQAAQSGPHPILLWQESRAGHGAGKPLGKIIAQLVDEWSFLMSQLGIAKP
jgi:prolyl oligopeptidase